MKGGAPPFRGWPPEALTWFAELEANNSRPWFMANRRTYDEAVRQPLESLLAEVADEFGEAKVFRPNRDTRFSADKTPYKTQLAAAIWQPRGGTYYVQLSREGLFVGGGLYAPDRDRLAAIRKAIAEDRRGRELEGIVAELRRQRLALMEEGALKTAPKGYPVDHPRIGLLRLVHLAAGRSDPPRKWLHTAAAKDRVTDLWRRLTPLNDWIAAELAQPCTVP